MAVGTGFGQVFRGLGQVGGVAISSAVFQTMLEKELRKRIVGRDDAEEVSHPSCFYTSNLTPLVVDKVDSSFGTTGTRLAA